MNYIYNDENLKFAVQKLQKKIGEIFKEKKEKFIIEEFGDTLRT